jgi:hypothetical protein
MKKNGVRNQAVPQALKIQNKKSLPQIAHLHCRKSCYIAIGKPTLGF